MKIDKTDLIVGIFFVLFAAIALYLGMINVDNKLTKCEKINNRQCSLNELSNY
jgi:hypothetical protein